MNSTGILLQLQWHHFLSQIYLPVPSCITLPVKSYSLQNYYQKKKINLKMDILSRICSILLCLTLGCVGSELNTFYILRERFPNLWSERVPRTILGIYLGIHRQHSVYLLSHTGKTEAPVPNGSSNITGC